MAEEITVDELEIPDDNSAALKHKQSNVSLHINTIHHGTGTLFITDE